MTDTAKTSPDRELTEAESNLAYPGDVPLYKFVLTGGPCGGKTTALARVFLFLRERGFEVITCPEAFTVLATNGMSFDFFTTPGMGKIIQGTVMDVQMNLEDSVERVLRARGKPAVILSDRGVMDGSVYVTKDEFQQVMDEHSTDVVQLRDNRYDAVFHLVTCADGAEKHYTLENNKARTETPGEAITADKKTQKAWLGHPHLYVLDNTTDFEGKMERLMDVVSKLVGLPSNLKRRSAKFLLSSSPHVANFPEGINYKEFEVEKIYLQQKNKNEQESYSFARRRTNIDSNGKLLGSVCQLTSAHMIGDELIEQKRIITQREYSSAILARDPTRHVVLQRRICFLYELQSFSVHIYEQPAAGVCILHAQVEATDEGEPEVNLPPFLNIERRLTNTKADEQRYGAYSLSVIREE